MHGIRVRNMPCIFYCRINSIIWSTFRQCAVHNPFQYRTNTRIYSCPCSAVRNAKADTVHSMFFVVWFLRDATPLIFIFCRAIRFPGGRRCGREGLPAPRRFCHHADQRRRPAKPPGSLPAGGYILSSLPSSFSSSSSLQIITLLAVSTVRHFMYH